jgi:N-acetylmuramoyl-L-alanine amidase
MSASPTNAPERLTKEQTSAALSVASQPSQPGSSHEALQALLAFSSLHAQIRERRARSGQASPADDWEVERFVLDEVLQLVAERALAITGADGVAVALAEADEIVCRGSAGVLVPDTGARLDPNSGFSGACFRSGQVIRCDNAENDPRVNLQAAKLLGARSIVAVPLAGQNCVIGLLEAFSYDAYGFNDSDVRSLNLLAELILAALRPEEEDRLAEISRQVRVRTAVPPVPVESAVSRPAESKSHVAPSPVEKRRDFVPDTHDEPEETADSRPGLRVVLIVLLVAVMFGSGVVWKLGHQTQSAAIAVPHSSAVAKPVVVSPAPSQELDSAPPEDPASDSGAALNSSETVQQKLSVLPQVTGIRHWSATDSSTVVIDLQDQVQYEAHRLANPERIYFDLHDTALAPAFSGKTIEVGDRLLTRIRIAQPIAGVTRIVLDTKGGSNFSVSLETNPYRLVVEVRTIGSKPQPRAKVDLFAPADSPALKTVAPVPTSGTEVHAGATGLRIALDAGHGGWDLGTVGHQGLLEKDLTLDIVERLGSLIEKRLGAEVIYTRQDDTYIALDRRAEIANQAQADLFVSIHANNSDSTSARGVETYYTNTFSSLHAYSHDDPRGAKLQTVSFANIDIRDKVTESRKIAADIQRALYSALAAKNRGIRDRGVKKASYVVLTGTSMPAVLAEVSFVSSPTDETNLQSAAYRQGIAEALYKGIARYTDAPRKVKTASSVGRPTLK